jgi:NAD(P)H-flavin reductase
MDVTVLQIRPEPAYSYEPGQSFSMEIPQRPRLWRYYSPANAPRDDGTIDLHVQRIDGGQVSGPLIRSVKPGDVVRLGAPVGEQLTVPEHDDRDLIMVAGGTGLAPFRAVVEQIDRRWEADGAAPKVHLFHGVGVPWNLYGREIFNRLAAARPWFEYTEVVSDDPSYPGARGLVGSVATADGPWEGRTALVCGGPRMVEHTVQALTGAGMPADDIRYEQFQKVDAEDPAEDGTEAGVSPND